MSKIKDYVNILRLKTSKYFDEKYYKLENPEVKGNLAKHYYYIGYKEGMNPSKYFDNDYYLNLHKDVKDAGVNPLIHYLKKGRQENRKIKGFNGINISRLYYKLYHEIYDINIHLVNRKQEINFIVNRLDTTCLNILEDLIKKHHVDRILYFNGDVSVMKNFSHLIICEKISKDYYVDIGINDLNICFDRQSLIVFNNNSYINNIYMYVDKIDFYDKEFINYLAYYSKIGKLNILSPNNLKICSPVFYDVPDLLNELELNFVFKNNLILGLEMMNDYILKNYISLNKKIYYESENFHYTISLEKNVNVFCRQKDKKMKQVIFDMDYISLDKKNPIVKFKTSHYLKIYKLEQILKNK